MLVNNNLFKTCEYNLFINGKYEYTIIDLVTPLRD